MFNRRTCNVGEEGEKEGEEEEEGGGRKGEGEEEWERDKRGVASTKTNYPC